MTGERPLEGVMTTQCRATELEAPLYEGGSAMASRVDEAAEALEDGKGPFERRLTPCAFEVQNSAFLAPISPMRHGVPEAGPTGLAEGASGLVAVASTRERHPEKASELLSLVGKRLSSCGVALLQKILEVLPLRSKNTGKREKTALFPLPTSRDFLLSNYPGLTEDELTWLIVVCVSLNSFWGSEVFFDGEWTDFMRQTMNSLVDEVKYWCGISAVVPPLDWGDLFRTTSVDYRGEEVKIARKFKWSNVGPALPQDEGSVPLREVCTLGCKHYVDCFDQYLKPPAEWATLTRPKVMVADEDWGEVCQGLVATGVCVYIDEDDVFKVGSQNFLNGLFGVTKDEFTARKWDRDLPTDYELNPPQWPLQTYDG